MYLDDHRTALYRFYDEGGALLYVGITANVEERFAHHRNYKEWWPQVARHTVEWFDTRPPAQAAELKAIHEERPVHNVNGTPWATSRRELEPEERTISQLRGNLTEHCQRVRLRGEAVVVVDSTRARKPVAALVSVGFYEQALHDRALIELLKQRVEEWRASDKAGARLKGEDLYVALARAELDVAES